MEEEERAKAKAGGENGTLESEHAKRIRCENTAFRQTPAPKAWLKCNNTLSGYSVGMHATGVALMQVAAKASAYGMHCTCALSRRMFL